MDDIPSQGHNGIGSSVAWVGGGFDHMGARAVFMGAAGCDQTALLSAIVHAPHMADGEISKITTSYAVPLAEITDEGDAVPVSAGHTWNELQRGDRDDTSTVVMDAWSNGPTIRLRDSAWDRAPAEALSMKNRVDGLVPWLRSDNDVL
ncbi:hypothetical protein [Rhizobium ruizarguesonis]